MANTLLTPTMITREAHRILHQKSNFLGTINRQYDDRFARSGAKIGDTLQIRLPNEYTVTTGATLNVQDTEEKKVDLTVATQKHVGMKFTSAELTLDLQDFSERIIEPAVSVLAASIEADVMNVYKDIYNEVSDVGATATKSFVLKTNKVLTDNLAPTGSQRCMNMNTTDNLNLVDSLTGLFNPNANITQQFREGMVADKFLGYGMIYENTLWPTHTTGTDDGTGDYLTNLAVGSYTQGQATLTVDTGAGTWKKGDIFYMSGVFRVHPESKESTGLLQPFVVTSDVSASATSIPISPAMYTTGGRQNISNFPADDTALEKLESDVNEGTIGTGTAIGNAADYKISLGYHKDAFAIATADLEMPNGVDFKSRVVGDGISMRLIRDYDINNDSIPARLDVLYGYKTVREQLACRLGLN